MFTHDCLTFIWNIEELARFLAFCVIVWLCVYVAVCVCVCVAVDPETAGGWREAQVFCTCRVWRYSLRLIPKCHTEVASTLPNPGRPCASNPFISDDNLSKHSLTENSWPFLIPEWNRAIYDRVRNASSNSCPSAWLNLFPSYG